MSGRHYRKPDQDSLECGNRIDEARRHIERELDVREAELLRKIPGAINFD